MTTYERMPVLSGIKGSTVTIALEIRNIADKYKDCRMVGFSVVKGDLIVVFEREVCESDSQTSKCGCQR